jgi:hypothetical protein
VDFLDLATVEMLAKVPNLGLMSSQQGVSPNHFWLAVILVNLQKKLSLLWRNFQRQTGEKGEEGAKERSLPVRAEEGVIFEDDQGVQTPKNQRGGPPERKIDAGRE